MSWQQAFVLAVLAALIVLLARDSHAPAVLFSSVAFLFLALDLVSVRHALEAFTNTGLVTVVLLLLVSVVLDKSRLIEALCERLVHGSYRRALVKLVAFTGAYSAFVCNTAVVASLIGPLRANRQHNASRLLLPMCYWLRPAEAANR